MNGNLLWQSELAYKSKPLLSIEELDAALSEFERFHPEATAKSVNDQAANRYTELAEQAARRIVMLNRETASMIYRLHTPLFLSIGDFSLLTAAACLHFSTEKERAKKVKVMADLNEWRGKVVVNHPFSERWKTLYNAKENERLIELWKSLADLYQDFLLNPDWG